jgi:hypothetical protein
MELPRRGEKGERWRKRTDQDRVTQMLALLAFAFCRGALNRPVELLPTSVKPLTNPRWWALVDSNHGPHPYQGCALTT